MAKRPKEDAEEIEITSLSDLRHWLSYNHGRAAGVWLIHHKKASRHHVDFSQIVDECLCWGWVDSLTRGKDEMRSMHWIAPRNPKSNWSRVNKEKVTRLMAVGRMAPSGLAMVETAKTSGTWSALDDVEDLVIPPDLQRALDGSPGAEAVWHASPRSVKRGALEILLNAKRAQTRAAKISEILLCTTEGERPFQWQKRAD